MAVAELKRELQIVVEALVEEEDDDDYNLDTAIKTLRALKGLKLKKSDQEYSKIKNLDFQDPPVEFRCPISGILMKNPVVVASGQTYEESIIQKWLKDGHQTCPQTDQPLDHTLLIPNLSIKKMIIKWCNAHQIDHIFNGEEEQDYAVYANREHLTKLLENLSSPFASDQTEAAKELRFLTARSPSFRALFGEISGSIQKLLGPIDKAHHQVHEDLITTILNISCHESNKRQVVEERPETIYFLIKSLMREKSIETRSQAAAALSSLSSLDSNKGIIGTSGAIRPLIELIEEGHPLVLKDSALAILNLCTVIDNRERVVYEGGVIAVMDKILGRVLIDEMLEILAILSGHHRAIEEMEESGMLFCLFGLMREDDISERNKEFCVAIVYAMCFSDRRKLRKICEVGNAYETLCRVARNGTSRAKRKASGILERMNRFAFVSLSHTA